MIDESLATFISQWELLDGNNKESFLKYLIETYGYDRHNKKNLLSYMNLIQTESKGVRE